MSLRIVQILAANPDSKALKAIIDDSEVIDKWKIEKEGERTIYSLLIHAENTQETLDKLQAILGYSEQSRVTILSVEATIPRPTKEEVESDNSKKKAPGSISREELYDDVSKNATLNSNFLLLVFFSTIVASIGLMEDNVAVVIGAMVIAPLLGPNLALALAAALGDLRLMKKSILTNITGLGISIGIAFLIGVSWPNDLESQELLLRTNVALDGIVLALASGAAAVLSLTARVSSVLVGVMVSVALLPPAVTFGIMAGAQDYPAATNAGLLLLVNIVCVNLSAKLVFFFKGIRPRTWYEKTQAKKAMVGYTLSWVFSLLAISLVIYSKTP